MEVLFNDDLEMYDGFMCDDLEELNTMKLPDVEICWMELEHEITRSK